MDKYTLKTAYQKSFFGLVWRMEVDTSVGLLAVETRDAETGNPSFSALRYRTGVSLIHELPYGDRNWTLAGAVDGRLILKAFGQDSPEGTGIACIDAGTGEVVWEQFNYVLLAVVDGLLLVRHRTFAGGYEQYLDAHTGDLTQFNISADKPTGPGIVIPQRYGASIPVFLANYAAYGDIFHGAIGSKEVWAFHEKLNQAFCIRLVVSSGSNVLDDKVVLSDLPKMLPEIFFSIAEQLFLIGDNKRKIVSYLV